MIGEKGGRNTFCFEPRVLSQPAEAWGGLARACFLLFLLSHAVPGPAQEGLYPQYERMWPMLSQPWFFNNPSGVAVDSSRNVYVSDGLNNRVIKYTSDGQVISILGSGSEGFLYPMGVAVDVDDNLYVAAEGGVWRYTSAGSPLPFSSSLEDGPVLRTRDGTLTVDPADVTVMKESGHVFVIDRQRFLVQRYDASGLLLNQWGDRQGNDGARRNGIAADGQGNIYVSDSGRNEVWKYRPEGTLIQDILSPMPAEGPSGFQGPAGIAIDALGFIYVADLHNRRILRFTPQGDLNEDWEGITELGDPAAIAFDDVGNIYVAEGEDRIQKFTSEGAPIAKWATSGSASGRFDSPEALDVGPNGLVYVADTLNGRIQVFSGIGEFEREWRLVVPGEPDRGMTPMGIVVDETGFVYVSNDGNSGDRVLKFTTSGDVVADWGVQGNALIGTPIGLALDGEGTLYVVDSGSSGQPGHDRILRFSSSGELLGGWGGEGAGEGQFRRPSDIAIDDDGNVYVSDTGNFRVQKFTADGDFLLQWGAESSEGGVFSGPRGIDVDNSGKVYVADSSGVDVDRILVFASTGAPIGEFGETGEGPGRLSEVGGVAVDSGGLIYIADRGNDRVQLFEETPAPPINKAIIVTGGSPGLDEGLWEKTQMLTNFAYRALIHQGFSTTNLLYLSADSRLDLDNDPGTIEISGEATKEELSQAIGSWSISAQNVVVYLTGPASREGFLIAANEIVSAVELDGWLDNLQDSIPGTVVVVYDASHAGTFVADLMPAPGKARVVVTSTGADENAYFMTGGTLSFSNYFWLSVFRGQDVLGAFRAAQEAVGLVNYQHPILNDDGDGVGNETGDGALAAVTSVFAESQLFDASPRIGSVSPPQQLTADESSAGFFARDVSDDLGAIGRVWGVVTPPFVYHPEGAAVLDLPMFELNADGEGGYTGEFIGFDQPGQYAIDIYTLDSNLNVGSVARTAVSNAILAASLFCIVSDAETGAPILNASVSLSPSVGISPGNGANGVYAYPALPASDYTVTASAANYESVTKAVSVRTGELVSLTFELPGVAAGEGEGEGEGQKPGGPLCFPSDDSDSKFGSDLVILILVLLVLGFGVQARCGRREMPRDERR